MSRTKSPTVEDAARAFLKVAPVVVSCRDLHHAKKDQHLYDAMCPIVIRYEAAREKLVKALKQ